MTDTKSAVTRPRGVDLRDDSGKVSNCSWKSERRQCRRCKIACYIPVLIALHVYILPVTGGKQPRLPLTPLPGFFTLIFFRYVDGNKPSLPFTLREGKKRNTKTELWMWQDHYTTNPDHYRSTSRFQTLLFIGHTYQTRLTDCACRIHTLAIIGKVKVYNTAEGTICWAHGKTYLILHHPSSLVSKTSTTVFASKLSSSCWRLR